MSASCHYSNHETLDSFSNAGVERNIVNDIGNFDHCVTTASVDELGKLSHYQVSII